MLGQILLNSRLEPIDWVVILGYLMLSITISFFFIKHRSENIEDFFLLEEVYPGGC